MKCHKHGGDCSRGRRCDAEHEEIQKEIERLRKELGEASSDFDRQYAECAKLDQMREHHIAAIERLRSENAELLRLAQDARDAFHRMNSPTGRETELQQQLAESEAVLNRPLHDDLNVLLNRCEASEPLSLADQRELYEWLEERGRAIAKLENQIVEAEARAALAEHQLVCPARGGDHCMECVQLEGAVEARKRGE